MSVEWIYLPYVETLSYMLILDKISYVFFFTSDKSSRDDFTSQNLKGNREEDNDIAMAVLFSHIQDDLITLSKDCGMAKEILRNLEINMVESRVHRYKCYSRSSLPSPWLMTKYGRLCKPHGSHYKRFVSSWESPHLTKCRYLPQLIFFLFMKHSCYFVKLFKSRFVNGFSSRNYGT